MSTFGLDGFGVQFEGPDVEFEAVVGGDAAAGAPDRLQKMRVLERLHQARLDSAGSRSDHCAPER